MAFTSDAFRTYRPLDFLPDLRFGVSLSALFEELDKASSGPHAADQLQRVETQSFTISPRGEVVELVRMHRANLDVTAETLQRATRAAAQHVIEAQLPDGRFRYTLHPFGASEESRQLNFPRQAGTTLILCELADSGDTTRAAVLRALEVLQRYERVDTQRNLSGLDKGRTPRTIWFSKEVN